MKIENKKKFPNKIEESAENDGGNFEICKKSPVADKYVGNDWGKYLNYPKIPQYSGSHYHNAVSVNIPLRRLIK